MGRERERERERERLLPASTFKAETAILKGFWWTEGYK